MLCFSNKVQVKYSMLENFVFKSVKERQRLVSAKGFSIFSTRYYKKGLMKLKHKVDLLKTKNVYTI